MPYRELHIDSAYANRVYNPNHSVRALGRPTFELQEPLDVNAVALRYANIPLMWHNQINETFTVSFNYGNANAPERFQKRVSFNYTATLPSQCVSNFTLANHITEAIQEVANPVDVVHTNAAGVSSAPFTALYPSPPANPAKGRLQIQTYVNENGEEWNVTTPVAALLNCRPKLDATVEISGGAVVTGTTQRCLEMHVANERDGPSYLGGDYLKFYLEVIGGGAPPTFTNLGVHSGHGIAEAPALPAIWSPIRTLGITPDSNHLAHFLGVTITWGRFMSTVMDPMNSRFVVDPTLSDIPHQFVTDIPAAEYVQYITRNAGVPAYTFIGTTPAGSHVTAYKSYRTTAQWTPRKITIVPPYIYLHSNLMSYTPHSSEMTVFGGSNARTIMAKIPIDQQYRFEEQYLPHKNEHFSSDVYFQVGGNIDHLTFWFTDPYYNELHFDNHNFTLTLACQY